MIARAYNWNPRYVEYANSHGRTPDEMLVIDKAEYPGGAMTGYIIWINARWREWKMINRKPANEPLFAKDHESFDLWLAGSVTK